MTLWYYHESYKKSYKNCTDYGKETYNILKQNLTYEFINMLHEETSIYEFSELAKIMMSQSNYQIISMFDSIKNCEINMHKNLFLDLNDYIGETIVISDVFNTDKKY
ncbi:MAG: hypothetical protein OXF28_04140 [Thaumarchaeota archaeon]|nr:hypothetical protein [Nitrososphaerota archaeon]